MKNRGIAALILAAMLICSSSAQGRLFDKWGFGFGTGKLLGSNTSNYVQDHEVRSRTLFLNGAFLLAPECGVWIEFSTELRYMYWGSYERIGVGYSNWSSTHEIVPAVSFLYYPPTPSRFKLKPYLALGVEHNYWEPLRDSYDYYINDRQVDISSWSWFTGIGVAIPVGVPEFVFFVRYNEDLTDGFDPDNYFTPEGSRFSELHYMFGMNFNLMNR